MNRIFHARIAWYQWMALILFAVNGMAALWCKFALVGLLLFLLLIVLIEQIIHTTYTLTADGSLEVYQGRFMRKKVIPFASLRSVRPCGSMRVGRWTVTRYVLVEYGKGNYVSLMPVKEREFLDALKKRMLRMNDKPL